ncbi:universal stress protein [Pelagibius marinus]|uniref:universal stress protein n=1 Tax=Pelagibius marinus TaxID=2762760 RepID=UPI0018726097|nr:universal stress protein [Pelagibius marinus]
MVLPTMRRILYATDLGDSAPRVFAQAVAMARQFDAGIVFLHAIEPLGPTAQTLVHNMLPQEQLQQLHSEGLAKLRSDIKQRIDRFCLAELGGAAEEGVEDIRIVDGHPAEVIVEQARELAPDLIVMGTHSHPGLYRTLLGSVARKVVSRVERPVLLVPIPEDVK